MRIVTIIAQISLAIALAVGGFKLYQWHKANPGANDRVEEVVQAPSSGLTPEQEEAQTVIKQWMKDNIRDRSASIGRWSQIVPVRGRSCVVASIEGKLRSGKKLVRTYVFEYQGKDLHDIKVAPEYLEGLASDARSATTTEQDVAIKNTIEHLKLIIAQVGKDDSPM
ncbi:hypothetical protein [Verrucomicrobium sp. BvORR034]|uniref:hypothetical protein n=1 Tax=Verrucomicrobium sp. BvORR034 TaxID=1396418 RepID=UPI000678B3A3|nr:hypothetical protein [Verrucomicrobium sp. BvORR034]